MQRQKLFQQIVERTTLPKMAKAGHFDTETPRSLFRVQTSSTKTFSGRYRLSRGKQLKRKPASSEVSISYCFQAGNPRVQEPIAIPRIRG